MNNKDFKIFFDGIAKINGFAKAFGGWFIESPETIVVLDLQKSNFGNYYQLIIKVYVQGVFGRTYVMSKDLVKKEIGNIRSGEPNEYSRIFDFENQLSPNDRRELLILLFDNHIRPFTEKALSRAGIIDMYQNENMFLLESIKGELGILNKP